MTSNARRGHRFDFHFGESYEHLVLPSGDLEQAPEGPGLYSWHIRLPRRRPERAKEFLRALFHDHALDVSVVGNMRQSWAGKLRTQSDAFDGDMSPALASAMVAIAYPLYIGISRTLRRRLLTHRAQLEIYKERPPARPEAPGDDDDAESRYFGQRLGSVFHGANFLETDRLFVKCVSWPTRSADDVGGAADTDAVMAELRAAERTCNTLFHPVFGRR